MADIAAFGDLDPLTAPLVERGTYPNVERGVHSGIFSKFCVTRKQPFANQVTQSIAMPHPSLTQILADRLNELVVASGLSNLALGRKAGVAANTIGNYRNAAGEFTSTGKPRSARLAEVERIADALGVPPLYLLTVGNHAGVAARTTKENGWPFQDVRFERWARLTERQKGVVEDAMNAALDRIEAAADKPANKARA